MQQNVLIAGAGSAGLTAAFFLARQGIMPRIIEKRRVRSPISKALGVNPRTLSIFKNTGITERFLENGWKCHAMNFWSGHHHLYRNDFGQVQHEYPFMLIQPQYDTERIIEEALADLGVHVERGLSVERVLAEPNATFLELKHTDGDSESLAFNGIVAGADGNKSRVRESLGIPFRGWEHKEEFRLYDVELDTPLTNKEGHYIFFREGGIIMLYIRDGIWRVGGNVPDVFDHLPPGTKVGRTTWDTTFTIREKVADTFSMHNVHLLGDAAHIHSPAGAKGMNLCIEDGYIFADLVAQDRVAEFSSVRRKKISQVVGILGQLTDKVGGRNIVGNTLRSNMRLLSFAFPVVMPMMRKLLLGLK